MVRDAPEGGGAQYHFDVEPSDIRGTAAEPSGVGGRREGWNFGMCGWTTSTPMFGCGAIR
ncbi:hypothetical protein Athai_57720 [Actinocatenispora thailandica]|uniref:Uncharacterized protein n=1 Tax=Actinocatenispora thailandica TaxID=227318 RepID=A0A7R7I094_9ACTN|nr:hypothetical protein Athai_57720 [Actinocatenispora thailandica]